MTENSCPMCASTFGSLLAKGILMIILGILMMVFTLASLFASEILLAILLIFVGITLLTAGTTFFGEAKRTWWVVVLGVLVILFGILTLINPGIMLVYAMYVLAAAALIGGVTDLAVALMGKSAQFNRGLLAVSGILGIILGVLFLINPVISAFTIIEIAGIFFFAFGIVAIIEAFMAKSASA
ncbi:HdeD family acid-resistance protein [Methanocorpusculum bavaricum]|uniref:HdeD family acid-resistance protein n=1 Tax=Methanocorpusculum bavaricum TaxID=71518 RepID=UPI00138B1153|nr:DUF308 domain-containing protein [Methanocorpusculum bavaricum]